MIGILSATIYRVYFIKAKSKAPGVKSEGIIFALNIKLSACLAVFP